MKIKQYQWMQDGRGAYDNLTGKCFIKETIPVTDLWGDNSNSAD